MKLKSLLILFAAALMVVASGCKKEAKPGQLESLSFKQSSYSIAENNSDLNLRKELQTVPEGVKDTAKISYAISDETIAVMNGNFLDPQRDGDVTVTVTIQGKSAKCSVTITKVEIEDFELEDFSVEMKGTAQAFLKTTPSGISHSRFTWSVADNSIATIDQDGVVTSQKVGKTTVTATAGGKSKSCYVTVEDVEVTSITLSKTEITFTEINEYVTISATIEPENARYLIPTWKSSDTDVAKVVYGAVTCKGPGTAVITATVGGKTAECKVTVPLIAATSIKVAITKSTEKLTIGQIYDLTATVLPSKITEPLQWSKDGEVDNPGHASFYSIGKSASIKPSEPGEVIVKCAGSKTSDEIKLSIAPESGSVTDACGNTYKTVRIGNQWWMAENMRCHKYSLKSERPGKVLSNANLTTPTSWYDPFYYDFTSPEFSTWTAHDKDIKGYMYNWAAAVALASESEAKAQKSGFSKLRQGICPEGWHLPTRREWQTLFDYVGSTDSERLRRLATKNNWDFVLNRDYDMYEFYALPVGYYGHNYNEYDYLKVGYETKFWSATAYSDTEAYYTYMGSYDDGCYVLEVSSYKDYGFSVRCVKD